MAVKKIKEINIFFSFIGQVREDVRKKGSLRRILSLRRLKGCPLFRKKKGLSVRVREEMVTGTTSQFSYGNLENTEGWWYLRNQQQSLFRNVCVLQTKT